MCILTIETFYSNIPSQFFPCHCNTKVYDSWGNVFFLQHRENCEAADDMTFILDNFIPHIMGFSQII